MYLGGMKGGGEFPFWLPHKGRQTCGWMFDVSLKEFVCTNYSNADSTHVSQLCWVILHYLLSKIHSLTLLLASTKRLHNHERICLQLSILQLKWEKVLIVVYCGVIGKILAERVGSTRSFRRQEIWFVLIHLLVRQKCCCYRWYVEWHTFVSWEWLTILLCCTVGP